jgi:hypothetical protein
MTMRLRRDVARCVHVKIGDIADAAGIIDLIPDIIRALSSRDQTTDRLATDDCGVAVVEGADYLAAESAAGCSLDEQTARMVRARIMHMKQVPRWRWLRATGGWWLRITGGWWRRVADGWWRR